MRTGIRDLNRLAIFDCDGTLVDGQAEVCEAMELAFRECGLSQPDRSVVRKTVGLSLPQAIFRLAPEAAPVQHQTAILAYKRIYREKREAGCLREPLFAGMGHLLSRLRKQGWVLGVATGKSARGLRACLSTHNLHQHFMTLQTADHHPSKPDPSMVYAALQDAGLSADNAVVIGDTSFDIEMASNAGVRSLGVAWGYHDPRELQAAGAHGIADTVDQLEALLCA